MATKIRLPTWLPWTTIDPWALQTMLSTVRRETPVPFHTLDWSVGPEKA
jgi:hypothetical protein